VEQHVDNRDACVTCSLCLIVLTHVPPSSVGFRQLIVQWWT
jgi:hypothetical protein